MRKQQLYILLTFGFGVLFLFLPHAEIGNQKGNVGDPSWINEYLIDELSWDNWYGSIVILSALFFPFILSLQFLFIPSKFQIKHRILFAAQGVIVLVMAYILFFIMFFYLFCTVNHFISVSASILSFVVLHAIWSIALAIPYFDRFRVLRCFIKE